MAAETVRECINFLNNEDFYTKKIQSSLFKNFKIAMCYLSVVKYEQTFYKNQGEYTKNRKNSIIHELDGKIKNVLLQHKDGHYIDCWDINPYQSKKYIIVFCGIGSEKTNPALQKTYIRFIEQGCGVFAFDYSGRGKSEGVFCQKNALKDAFLVRSYLHKKGVSDENIGIVGHSMGAAVALDFASRINSDFVVLINPFNKAADMIRNISQQLNLPDFIKRLLQNLPDFLIPIKNRFNNERALKKIASPVLIIHTKNDRTIPAEFSRKLYLVNSSKPNISYIETDGSDHEINDEKLNIAVDFIRDSID